MLHLLRRSPTLAAIVPIFALACAALACTAHGPIEPATAPATPSPTPDPTPPPIATPTAEPAKTPAAAPVIGWASDLREQPKAARKHNSDALKLHRKGDYTASLAGFDAALAIAPNMAIAHFNRACALTHLGRISDAAEVMRRLLAIDLLAFGPRLDADADLAGLRSSPEAAGLAKLRDELTTQYAAAVTRGIPVQIYELVEGAEHTSQQPFRHKHRAGVWLTDSNTFVPVTPEIDASFAVVWSHATATVTVLHGPLTGLLWQVIPGEFAVDVYDLTRPGTRLRSHPAVKASFARLFPRNAKQEDIEQWDMRFQKIGVRPLPDRTQIEAFDPSKGQPLRIELGGPEPIAVKQPPATGSRHDTSVREGVLVEALPDGYARTKSALTVPGRAAPIDLGKLFTWTQVVPTPDKSAAFVLTQKVGCDRLGHRLLRLDLKSHELRELSTGATAGTLTPALDGTLYFQLDATTRRLAPDGTFTDVALPPWLQVAQPIKNVDCYL